uniref:Centromere protein Q n=1 Tax=Oncorhynchus mykiss TaxID=8022 RepID=A0A8K9WQA0_ONCMY
FICNPLSVSPSVLPFSLRPSSLPFSLRPSFLPPSFLSPFLPPSFLSLFLPPSFLSLFLPPSFLSLFLPPSFLSLFLPPSFLSLFLPPSFLSLFLPPSFLSLFLPPSFLSPFLAPSVLPLSFPRSLRSVLAGRRTNKEESQEHLNIVKNRFLSKLAQLSVPIQKQEMMIHSSRQHQEETRKSAVGEKILNKLVAELGAVVGSLKQLEKERDSLENQCFNLRQLLEQQEESNQQILQLSEQGVLRLPPVPQRKDRPLQEQMVCLVHSSHSVTTARCLAKTLQTSGPVQDAQTLLERAYRHADRLITPPTAVSQ